MFGKFIALKAFGYSAGSLENVSWAYFDCEQRKQKQILEINSI